MQQNDEQRAPTQTPAGSAGVRVFRGIRGAITVEADDRAQITRATERLLREVVSRNEIELEDIASVLFTLTPDLHAAFPALAARDMGWTTVPMLHAVEVDVPGALGRVIRILMHVNTTRSAAEIEHVYLDGAAVLRPDLVRR
ncbi:MAG TPA: chorismate mutase [Candidatus Cybelea sp.]|nr:chorismate mutase [Candidatus Cybelea sp.]